MEEQGDHIAALVREHRELSYQVWCGKRENLGRQKYIEHLTTQIHKGICKAKEMVKEAEALRQVVAPVGEHGQRLLNFIEEAKAQYEQIKQFYGYNARMINSM